MPKATPLPQRDLAAELDAALKQIEELAAREERNRATLSALFMAFGSYKPEIPAPADPVRHLSVVR